MAADGHLNFDTKINTRGVEKGLGTIEGLAGGLRSVFTKLGAVIGVAFSVSALQRFTKEARELWNVQLEAETKLETILGRNLGAARDQIQAVKDYASALQEVGVIGDEVQLSGLQELATYIENAGSLRTMNEVLNDMLAQQYGLNATAESAVTIATMLGKVLSGQTGALSRYGYSFTAAQEQLLKFGTEEQRVATLAEVVEQSVGGINEALANTDAGRMKQLENTMGDIKEEFGAAVTQIQVLFLPALKRLAQMLAEVAAFAREVSQSLAEVFGTDSRQAAAAAGAAQSYEDMAEAAEETEEANERTLMSFDKINKIGGEDSGSSEESSIAAPILTADTQQAEGRFTGFFDSIREQLESLKKYIDKNFGSIFKDIWAGLSDEAETLKTTLGGVFDDLSNLEQPLRDYISNDLTTLLQTAFSTAGNILTGLFNSFNRIFSDIWNLAAFPMLQSFINLGLPMLTQFATQSLLTLGTLFDSVKEIFDKLWQEAAAPILEGISQLWTDMLQTMSDFWNEWGTPIFDGFREAIENTRDTLLNAWDIIFKPIFDSVMENLDKIWSEHLQPLLSEFLDFFGELITGGEEIYNRFILPLVNAFIGQFGPIIVRAMKIVTNTVGDVVGDLIDAVRGVIKSLRGVVQFLTGVFTGDWKKAWQGIKNIFKGVWDAFYNIVKTPINLIIGIINRLVGGIESTVNHIIDDINGLLDVDIPDWVPGVGGQHFGLQLDKVDLPEIPKLAQGTVVPANYGEFLAVLGDNRRETEIVSPMSTIEQAVMSAMLKLGGQGGRKQPLVVQVVLDKKVVGQAAIDDINDQTKLHGYSPLKT
ncbi:MAG: hypothetical protein IJ740_08225 [Ruminococcus sp.]|nr:hypothetical protein [Ruminococcus sp.]